MVWILTGGALDVGIGILPEREEHNVAFDSTIEGALRKEGSREELSGRKREEHSASGSSPRGRSIVPSIP